MYRIKIIKGNPYVYEQRSIRLKNGRVKTKTIRYLGRLTPELREKLGITAISRRSAATSTAQGKPLSSKRKKKGYGRFGPKRRS